MEYIKHVLEKKVVTKCLLHHSRRENKHLDMIPQKKIRLFLNEAPTATIRRYNPKELLSLSADTINKELIRMQDKMTLFVLELYLIGGFSQRGDGCNASDMRCLVDVIFGDVDNHYILLDDLLASSNVEINNSFGMKVSSGKTYRNIHGTNVKKRNKLAIPLMTGLVKDLCGLCDDDSSRPIDKNLTITPPDEQSGIKVSSNFFNKTLYTFITHLSFLNH